jgi:hypothetical protein
MIICSMLRYWKHGMDYEESFFEVTDMKTVFISILATAMICLYFSGQCFCADKPRAKFEPADGSVLLIIGQDNKTIEEYIKETGNKPGGFMLYGSPASMESFSSCSKDYGSGIAYADELLRRHPNTVLQMGYYMVDLLERTCSGEFDNTLSALAEWCRKARVPVFLRIGYEFDGLHNHYEPAAYQKAFRYIVDKLRSKEAYNVAFVWHAHAHSPDPDLEAYYPGDEYVDWVGISYFAQPQEMMKPVLNFAAKHGKPVMIAESTPQGMGTLMGKLSWNTWFNPFFHFMRVNPAIKAISYINSNWEEQPMWQGQGWQDARVQADDVVKKCWLKEIEHPKYLKSSRGLFKKLGYNPSERQKKGK